MKSLLYGILVSSVSICAVFFCGCSLLPEPAVNVTKYYDLGIPAKTFSAENGDITVQPFTSSSGDRYRMISRKGNLLSGDDNNKWQMPPGSLLTKYLTLTFSRDPSVRRSGDTQNILSGNVVAFEADRGEAVLGLRYKIRKFSGKKETPEVISKSLMLREKIKENTPESFASAMSRAAERAAMLILKDINGK